MVCEAAGFVFAAVHYEVGATRNKCGRLAAMRACGGCCTSARVVATSSMCVRKKRTLACCPSGAGAVSQMYHRSLLRALFAWQDPAISTSGRNGTSTPPPSPHQDPTGVWQRTLWRRVRLAVGWVL